MHSKPNKPFKHIASTHKPGSQRVPAPKPVAPKPIASKPIASIPAPLRPVANKPNVNRPVASNSGANKSAPLKTDWDQVAGWYDQLVGDAGSEYHQHVVLPGVMRLLAPQPGQHAVDVACGQGVLCRLLQMRGVKVTGLDAATGLIESARKRGPADIEYHIHDARDLAFLPAAQADMASCVLAIQNIHPIQSMLAGVAGALKMGGRLVMVLMHPCFRGAKETSWGWDEAKKVQYRRVDRYLQPRKNPIITHPGEDPDGYTWTFHKPIGLYVKALRQAGLLVDAIEEWPSHKTSQAGGRGAAENKSRKEIPMFMAIRAIKVDRLATEADDDEPVADAGE